MDKSKESLFFFEQTGITEENFLASCVSEQENLRLSNTMKNSIIQRLSNIVSTGNESTSYKKAIDKKNTQRHPSRKRNHKTNKQKGHSVTCPFLYQ